MTATLAQAIGIRESVLNHFLDRVLPMEGCWQWSKPLHLTGYAYVCNTPAHRVSYQLFVGPIPEGWQIDHLCRNKGCVSPFHLEAVTQQENIRRQGRALVALRTHCPRGHNNFGVLPGNGKRYCKTCTAEHGKAFYERNKRASR